MSPVFRNITDDVVLDHLTQLVAGPDETIDVTDDIAECYRDHPGWAEVAEIKPPTKPVEPETPAEADAEA